MAQEREGYEIRPFPRTRKLVLDAGWIASRRHMQHGFVEVDVTGPRALMRAHKERTRESLSFTAYILACMGQAVETDRSVHAYRNWRNQLVIFDEVDATITIETEIEGQLIPMLHIVRAVNKRTCYEISAEIRSVQANPERSGQMGFMHYFPYLPAWTRRTVYRLLLRNPHLQKKYAGTVGLTSVGMMLGERSGWGVGMPVHSVAVVIGGITRKPGVIEDRIEIREYLDMTVSFDHNIVDGAPAARFTRRFLDLIEQGYGLVEEGVRIEQAGVELS